MDIDNKKSAGSSVQKPPINPIFLTTAEVAKEVGVTKQAVICWRKQGWFSADHIDNHGVYYYIAERVEQLKAIYRRDWETAWSGNSATDSEKKSVPEMFAYVEKQSNWRRLAEPTKRTAIADYFTNHFDTDIEQMKAYAKRLTGFDNLDKLQCFHSGLYVVCSTCRR